MIICRSKSFVQLQFLKTCALTNIRIHHKHANNTRKDMQCIDDIPRSYCAVPHKQDNTSQIVPSESSAHNHNKLTRNITWR